MWRCAVALRCSSGPAVLGLSAGTADADSTCDEQSCVPNIGQGVTIGDPCGNADRYVYATTTSGELAACADAGNRLPNWVASAPLVGVRDELSPCSPAQPGWRSRRRGALKCVADGSGAHWTVLS